MVDTLVESAGNVELILKYFDMFLKLKDLTSSPSFLEVDLNKDGWVYPKDFKEKMEQQKSYTRYDLHFTNIMTIKTNELYNFIYLVNSNWKYPIYIFTNI